jgi:hypothetical protein
VQQLVVVDQVLVTERKADRALADQRLRRALDRLCAFVEQKMLELLHARSEHVSRRRSRSAMAV